MQLLLAHLPGLWAWMRWASAALPLISPAFVPTESMPSVVRAFAENQPVTSIVEAIRALLSQQPVGNDIWVALAWCVGILLVAYMFAMRAYKKRV